MISIDFNSQISFPSCEGVGVENFRKSEWEILERPESGVGYFTSDSATLVNPCIDSLFAAMALTLQKNQVHCSGIMH